MAHTRGRWVFVPPIKLTSVDGHESTIYPACVNDEAGVQIAKVTHEGDARAISALPDLLAALKAAIPQLEQLDRMLDRNADRMEMGRLPLEELDMARAAIAKAEGREG